MYEIIVIAESKERLALSLVKEIVTMMDDFSDRDLKKIRQELIDTMYCIDEILDDRGNE